MPKLFQSGDCAPGEVIALLALGRDAAGLMPESEAEAWMGHVAGCESCAGLLREAIESCGRDLSENEQKIATRLGAPTRPNKSFDTRWPIAAAVVVVLAGAGTWYASHQSSTGPEKLLAIAYTNTRRIELRWPDAKHGPLRVELGGNPGVGANLPASFYGAKQVVLQRIERGDSSPKWLSAYGQTLVLENQPDAAITQLKRVLDLSPADTSLTKVTLAIAYCQRGDALQRPIDYQAADQLLGEVLQSNPNHREALFNRAIVQGKLENPVEAVVFWNRLLDVERDEAWKREALNRKAEQEEKLKTKPKSSAESEFQDFLGANAPPSMQLAVALQNTHHDAWLADQIVVHGHPLVPVLHRIASDRKRIEFPEWAVVEPIARLAGDGFAPRPIRVWAAFEYAYWQTHSTAGRLWPEQAVDEALGIAEKAGYRWFAAQLLLERSTHYAFLGNQAANIADTEAAVNLAYKAQYGNLHLRTLNFLGSAHIRKGDYKKAMDTILRGMSEYWKVPADPMRAYHFLFDAMRIAQATGRPHAAYPPMRTAVGICTPAAYTSHIATSSGRAAEFLAKVGNLEEARQFFKTADQAISRLPQGDLTKTYGMLIDLSKADALRDPRLLDHRLEQMRAHDEPFMRLRYFRTRVDLLLEARKLLDTDLQDLTAAIRFAAASASSLTVGARLGWQRETAHAWRALVAAHIENKDPERAFAIWQRFLSLPASETSSTQIEQANHPGVARLRRSNTMLFAFFEYQGKMGRWVVDSSGVSFEWLSNRSGEIYRKSREIAVLASDRNSSADRFEAELHWFHRRLLAEYRGHTLLVQPDGELARIPWTALASLTGSSIELTPWISETPPSVDLKTKPGSALLVMADRIAPQFLQTLGPIPALENPVSIGGASEFPWRSIEGLDVTGERLDEGLPKTEVLQFVGHGYPTPDGVGLLMSPSRKYPEGVWQPAAGGLPLKHLRLAVFTACSTARYEEAQSSGPQNLAEAFLVRGAGTVVAALWNVDAVASASWTKALYRKLSGTSASAAVVGVNKEFGKQPETSHPYWWAAFQVYRLV